MGVKRGWNTWNVRSVLSHAHLPEGFAISLGIKSYMEGCCLREALIGRGGKGAQGVETVRPGPHAYDGSFTSLELEWAGVKVQVETAVQDDDWFTAGASDPSGARRPGCSSTSAWTTAPSSTGCRRRIFTRSWRKCRPKRRPNA